MRTAVLLLPFLFSCQRMLVELPAPHAGAPLAVIVSGDGGWRAIDRDIAAGLHERGYAVVGLNARKFFAERRTPDEASQMLQSIIRREGAQRVVAIGYSRGAGVLPFMINRLPPEVRARVAVVALVGLDRTIDFDLDDENAIPVGGEVARLRGTPVLCIFGTEDANDACRDLPVTRIALPGGHHMRVPYDVIARAIWSATESTSAAQTARIQRDTARIR